MNDEIITAVADDNSINESNTVPVNDTEKNVSPEKLKVSKAEKRLEKLTALKGKYEKASEARETAAKKADSINAQIEKLEKEIHAEEIAEIDKLCVEKNMSYGDIALIMRNIPDGMTAEEVINLFV